MHPCKNFEVSNINISIVLDINVTQKSNMATNECVGHFCKILMSPFTAEKCTSTYFLTQIFHDFLTECCERNKYGQK